jgi:magnesium transporter
LERQLIGRALESILVATSNALEEEMGYTRNLVRDLLADLEDDINRDNLKRLLHYSRRMAGFQSRARYVKRAVDEVLESGTSDFTYGGKT